MARKSLVAQEIMDLYYQQYKTNSDFFDKSDFVYFTGIGYADLVQAEYDKQYAMIRSEDAGQGLVSFDQSWVQTTYLKPKKDEEGYYADLPAAVMSFMTDRYNIGIQNVFEIARGQLVEIIRSTVDSAWQDQYLPIGCAGFFYLEMGRRIRLVNVQANKLKVNYVPSSEDPALDIPDTKAGPIIQYVLNLMFAAKDKRVVARVNNKNEQKTQQTEVDQNQLARNI